MNGNQQIMEQVGTWWTAAQAYLIRLGAAEYEQGIRAHKKTGRSGRTYRHNPSQYQRDMCAILGTGDEHAFKARKMLEGYTSVIRV